MDNNNSAFETLKQGGEYILQPICTLDLQAELSSDYIIPERISDADEILMCTSKISIDDAMQNGSTVEISGEIVYDLLILGEDGSVQGITYKEPLDIRDNCKDMPSGAVITIRKGTSEASCRLVNPRKINMKANVNVIAEILSHTDVSVNISGAESIDDDINIQRKHSEILSSQIITVKETDIPVNHDLDLDGNYPPMSEIIYSSVRLTPYECKSRGNTIDIKTLALLSTVYRSEEGNVFSIEKSFTLDKTIDTDNADGYEFSAHAYCGDINCEIAANSYGEMKIIELDFDYTLQLNGMKNTTVNTVTDMYSTEFECSDNLQGVKIVTLKRAYGSSLSINASAQRDEIAADAVRSALIGIVDVRDINTEYSQDKNKLILTANAYITAACENNITSEEDKRYSSVSFVYPFKYELDVGESTDSTAFSADIGVTDTRFRTDSTKIYCDFEANIRVFATETSECSFIKELKLDKSSPISRVGAPLTLCYPCGSESLWDIAKYYRITTDSIMASNGLDDESIIDKKVLLIPSYKPKRQLFSKVI